MSAYKIQVEYWTRIYCYLRHLQYVHLRLTVRLGACFRFPLDYLHVVGSWELLDDGQAFYSHSVSLRRFDSSNVRLD